MVEWGFAVEQLPCVGLLRDAGFDAWWFDGDESAARVGYVRRHGDQPASLAAYEHQVNDIARASDALRAFYGDRIVRTVTDGPTLLSPETIAARVLGEVR